MKIQKLFLESERDDDLTLGLVLLTKHLPDYELFYHINKANDSDFTRMKDLVKCAEYHDYYHNRFEAYHQETQTCFQFISNSSYQKIQKKQVLELFSDEEHVNFLLPNHKEVDYLIKTSDAYADFSLILQPENLMFPIQQFLLSSNEELFQLIQYYE